MDTLLAVLRDLAHFVLGRSDGASQPTQRKLPAHSARRVDVQATGSSPDETDSASTSAGAGVSAEAVGSREYVCVPRSDLLVAPYRTLDGVTDQLVYGTLVQVGQRSGRYVAVTCGHEHGWVLCEQLTADPAAVFPTLIDGASYPAEHVETEKLRSCIADAFAARALSLPLQSVEYVSYRLWRDGRSLPWGSERPRLPGSWQHLLRGQRGVTIGITPRTGAVLEYLDEEGTGHLAYVESVTPDEAITLAGVAAGGDGEFYTTVVPKESWREWRPVFIVAE